MTEWVFFVAAPFIALLLQGIRRKLNARMQNRIGPPVWQPFLDVIKLVQKGKSDSEGNLNFFFVIAPIIFFITTWVMFLFVPFAIWSFEFDFLLLIYLTILSGGLYVLAGFASDSPLGVHGAMREMITMVVYETSFTLCLFTFIVISGTLTLANYPPEGLLLQAPLAAVILYLIGSIELKITPFDTAEAPTEILEGFSTEFSGAGLAFLELGDAMKFLFFCVFIPFLLFGTGNMWLFALLVLLFVFIFTFSKVTTPRFRVDQVVQVYFVVLILAVINLAWVII
ncbi:MAG: NADH-quinone oxidoreductase subunit H [Candidatus Diapherotrites archaeon]|nr:NADH-quinone oxidoreductase subunit H [Candidatus Diapherotrites archaeon]